MDSRVAWLLALLRRRRVTAPPETVVIIPDVTRPPIYERAVRHPPETR